MHTLKNKWDVERAAAWLRKHAWGDGGEEPPPPLEQAPATPEPPPEAPEELDIAGWPALVAPFYD